MTVFEYGWRVFTATMAILIGKIAISGFITSVYGEVIEGMASQSKVFLPMLIATAVTVLALIVPVRLSRLRATRLFFALFLAIFGINVFLTQTEAYIFLAMEPEEILLISTQMTVIAGLTAFVMVKTFGRQEHAIKQADHNTGQLKITTWAGKISLASLGYMVLYLGAGMIIYPFIKDFYATQEFECGVWIVPLALLRGSLYVCFTVLLLRSISAPRLHVSLSMAFMLPVLAGTFDLLIPNPAMPEEVRLIHALEIGASNFIFGSLLGYIFWNQKA